MSKQQKPYKAWFDASVKDNSITLSYTIISHNNKVVKEWASKTESKKVKNINDAESYALFYLLSYITTSLIGQQVEIIGDSKMIIDYVKSDTYNYRIYRLNDCVDIVYRNRNISIDWQPRKHNKRADKLSKLAHKGKISILGKKDFSEVIINK